MVKTGGMGVDFCPVVEGIMMQVAYFNINDYRPAMAWIIPTSLLWALQPLLASLEADTQSRRSFSRVAFYSPQHSKALGIQMSHRNLISIQIRGHIRRPTRQLDELSASAIPDATLIGDY